jgi:hypothetical protein
MAQIDPVARGYLTQDSRGNFRLPALRDLGQINFLASSPSQTNILAEYELHNLSDADFTFSGRQSRWLKPCWHNRRRNSVSIRQIPPPTT